MKDILITVFLAGGVGFVLLAALGALRFQDALTRMAAVSKASTLGLTLIFTGVAIHAFSVTEVLKALATIVILWISAPIAAHLLGRAAVLTDEKLMSQTQNPELAEKIKKQ